MPRVKEREFTVPLARRIMDLANPNKLRSNSHDYKSLSKRHGVTQGLLGAEVSAIMRVAAPSHPYFEGRPAVDEWIHSRTGTMLEALYPRGTSKRKELEGAAKRALDKKAGTGFRDSREKRVKRLINSLSARIASPKNEELTRYSMLEKVMQRHGFEYEQMKGDLYAIAYAALLPEGGEPPVDGRAGDVKNARSTIKNSSLQAKAKRVAEWFLGHTPETDLERVRSLHPTKNQEVMEYQEKWAKTLGELRELHIRDGMDPVSAYAKAWKAAGYKEHFELPRNEYWVYRIHDYTTKLERGEHDEEMHGLLDIGLRSPKQALSLIEKYFWIFPDMEPNEIIKRIDDANLASWKSNYAKAQAHVQEQKARMFDGKRRENHQKAFQRYLSASKNHLDSDKLTAFAGGKKLFE